MNSRLRHHSLRMITMGTGIFILLSLVYGCTDNRAEARKHVENLLRAAHEKNYDKVRQSIDFGGMIDSSLQEQNAAGSLESGMREKIIDDLVKNTCEITKTDLEKALSSLRVELDKSDSKRAVALYNSTKRMGIMLTLEKRKSGWIITGIN